MRDPILDGNGESRWEHYFSVALGGLLANPSIAYTQMNAVAGAERAVKTAKIVADMAVKIKPN